MIKYILTRSYFIPILLLVLGCATTQDIDNLRIDFTKIKQTQADLMHEVETQNTYLKQISSKLDENSNNFQEITDQTVSQKDLKYIKDKLSEVEIRLHKIWTSTEAIPMASAENIYNSAHSDYLKGNYNFSVIGYKNYLELYPQGKLAEKVLHNLILSYFKKEDWQNTVLESDNFMKTYPESNTISNVKLTKAKALIKLKKIPEAKKIFENIIKTYPLTEDTKLAKYELEKLNSNE